MMEERLSRIMLACCMVYTVFAMFCMLRFSGTEAETDAAAGQETAGNVTAGGGRNAGSRAESYEEAAAAPQTAAESAAFPTEEAQTAGMRIPLPEGLSPDTLTVANYYDSRAVVVTLPGTYGDFYRGNVLTGSVPGVEGIFLSEPEGKTVLELRTTGLYECRYTVEGGMLALSFIYLAGTYDKVVVLDAGWRSAGAEQETIVDITQRVRQKLEAEGIHVCCTGLNGRLTPGEERAGYANALSADLLVSIRAGGEAQTGIRAFYNGTYVIPSFGSPELAALLERSAASASGAGAAGLLEMEHGDTLLAGTEIPAAAVTIGCLTDPEEAALLSDAQYRERLAEGIAAAVTAAFASGG